jgi:hypothetical protein
MAIGNIKRAIMMYIGLYILVRDSGYSSTLYSTRYQQGERDGEGRKGGIKQRAQAIV